MLSIVDQLSSIRPFSSPAGEGRARTERIVELMSDGVERTTREVAELLDDTVHRVSYAMGRLRDRGRLEVVGETHTKGRVAPIYRNRPAGNRGGEHPQGTPAPGTEDPAAAASAAERPDVWR